MSDAKLLGKTADTVRILAAEGVEQAGSGHPGLPMGCADIAVSLWYNHLRHSPEDPEWRGRDRFILSAGHGSMLLYSLLHLFGYDVTLEDLKQFRQWRSKTPGHPEYGATSGVEVTTGPLATGFGTAVGMAIAAKQLAARMHNNDLFDQNIFVLSSDGCMMEGASHECASLAGHLQLDNLVCIYDWNTITIEGATSLAYSDDPVQRYKAYGWNVLDINGHDYKQIDQALREAKNCSDAPTMIVARTTIGSGAPTLAGSADAHGAPLGEEEINGLKAALGFAQDQKFYVPEDVQSFIAKRCDQLCKSADEWKKALESFLENNPDEAELYKQLIQQTVPGNILEELKAVAPKEKIATRHAGGEVLQRAAALVPALIGGAGDLAPSTKTELKEESHFNAENRLGRNLHFGVRELGMGLVGNGITLFGANLTFMSTFFVFSDFMKPAIRLAAIQGLHQIYVFTHDSIFVGEDGPTHQPIEQLMMLRGIPKVTVIRPADAHETAHAWAAALTIEGPVAILLSRQKIDPLSEEHQQRINLRQGAYVIDEDPDFDMIMIASGSEVNTTLGAAEILRREGMKIRIVSMPSWELFEEQDETYKDSVLPASCRQRVSVEAGLTHGWERYTGREGLRIGVDHFGHSAPYQTLAKEYGLDEEGVAKSVRAYYR